MISLGFAEIVIIVSLAVTGCCYFVLSKYEGNYVHILVPSLVIAVPAYYLLPLFYVRLFGAEASTYAYVYVYATLAVENVCFVYAYTRASRKTLRLPFAWSYRNFTLLAVGCLLVGVAMYAPILLQFREFLFDPRKIYDQTRSGFGTQFFFSSTLAYLAIILILFTQRSRLTKAAVIGVATCLVLLHGSKGQVLNVILILALYHVYVRRGRVGLRGALVMCLSVGFAGLLLFAGTMTLGGSPGAVLESISQYSDYTRNAMLVIDSRFPLQYGRIALESNTVGLLPRALFPNKARKFGPFRLTEELYPDWFDAESSPAFGIGVQYADFGTLAIVYIALFALFRGWLARIFVNRLQLYRHPGDFFVVVFLADISLFPLGLGWFLPEALFVGMTFRYLSTIGANRMYFERWGQRRLSPSARIVAAGDIVR